jgi:alanine-glyoxylate transaminase/serine-glyoxylate transaminase/serine-pyruvate transaminase
MNYALREALRLVVEEGSGPSRVTGGTRILAAGWPLGSLVAQEGHRLPMLNAVGVPDGIDEARPRTPALVRIEVGAGLGR